MKQLEIKALPENKVIEISHFPDPEILSIDHDIDYYDVQEGTFNSFSPEDYTKLNQSAKDFILKKAEESDLYTAAEKQGQELLETIRFLAESAGWTLVYKDRVSDGIGAPIQ